MPVSPVDAVMLNRNREYDVGVQVAKDLGEYVRLLSNLGIGYEPSHSQVDDWLKEHGRVLVGITHAYGNVYGYGAVVERGYVPPTEGLSEGGFVDAYLLGLTKNPAVRGDSLGHQVLFIMPVLEDTKNIAVWVHPPHAVSPDDYEPLPNYNPDLLQHISGRPAEQRLLEVPLALPIRSAMN